MTHTLLEETTQTTGGNDPSKNSHWVKKEYLTDAYVFGTEVEALCGYRWVPHRDPKKLPVCQKCKEIYDALPA